MPVKTYKIFLGDSKKLIRRVPSNSVNLILADPPYNVSQFSSGAIKFKTRKDMLGGDIASWDRDEFYPEEWKDEFKRILEPKGNIFIFTSHYLFGKWRDSLQSAFDITKVFVWRKTNPAPQVRKVSFLNSCELVICAWNKKHKWNFLTQNEMHNFFESPICMGNERLKDPVHPTQKPVKLLEHFIKIASNEGDIVFDPFMGVGSTGVAALNLGRKFVGIEISNEYFNAAKKRLDTVLEANK